MTKRAATLLLMACAFALVFGSLLWRSLDPDEHDTNAIQQAYREEFGSDPPAPIADLHFRRSGRNEHCWFRFALTAQDTAAILARFEPSDEGQFRKICRLGSDPGWCVPPQTGVTYHRAYDWLTGVDSSVAVVAHHAQTGTVYFARYAVD